MQGKIDYVASLRAEVSVKQFYLASIGTIHLELFSGSGSVDLAPKTKIPGVLFSSKKQKMRRLGRDLDLKDQASQGLAGRPA